MINALVLATLLAVSPQPTIEKFLAEWKAGRLTNAYSLLSADARQGFGEATLSAYVASRHRALGKLLEFSKPVPFKEQYRSDLRFERGNAVAWFIVVEDGIEWFAIEVPKDTAITISEAEVIPIVEEVLGYAKRDGAAALTFLLSDEMLQEANQDRQTVHATLSKVDEILGKISKYELDAPAEMANDCRQVTGKGTFEHGQALLKVHVCWADGIWSLRHATITPDVTPAMVERMFAKLVSGAPKVTCPRNVPFLVGDEIACRVELNGEVQQAKIKRTSISGWEVVGLSK